MLTKYQIFLQKAYLCNILIFSDYDKEDFTVRLRRIR